MSFYWPLLPLDRHQGRWMAPKTDVHRLRILGLFQILHLRVVEWLFAEI
jgi:hypothetical protein